jgi:hypothetical protein
MTSNDKRVQSYLSLDMYKLLEAYANHYNISLSKAVFNLIAQGLTSFSKNDSSSRLIDTSNSVDLSNYVTKDEFNNYINACMCNFNAIENSIKELSSSNQKIQPVVEPLKKPPVKGFGKKSSS